jgi:putative oxidoreductase
VQTKSACNPPKVESRNNSFERFAAVCVALTLLQGAIVQRLFSTFACGWPGRGLLMQRLLLGIAEVYGFFVCVNGTPICGTVVPQSLGAIAGILLLAGLWTPVAGILLAIVEGWIAFSLPSGAALPAVLAVLGASLALIGPGAWSLDARLFGRKHIKPPEF